MTDPERLVKGHPSALARSLIAAALDEEPPRTLLGRTLAPLGIAAGVMAETSLSAAAVTTASPIAGAAASAAPAAAPTTAMLLNMTAKWTAVMIVGGALAAGTTAELTRGSASRASSVSSVTAQSRPSGHGAASDRPPPVLLAEPTRPRLPPPAAVPKPPRASSLRAEAASSLREEGAVIDEVREAVATGNGARAKQLLDDYKKRFPEPAFEPEALYLRVRALRLLGNESAARTTASRLLAKYPNGPHAASVRALFNPELDSAP
jgi:hypothetical protein